MMYDSPNMAPDIKVLDKAFEILKKAGFPQDKLDESYSKLKEVCEEGKESKPEGGVEIEIEKTTEVKPMSNDGMSGKEDILEGIKKLLMRKQ